MCFEELSPFLSHRVPNLENAIDDGKIVGSWRRIKSIFPSQHTGHRWFQFVLIFHTANRTPESLLNTSVCFLFAPPFLDLGSFNPSFLPRHPSLFITLLANYFVYAHLFFLERSKSPFSCFPFEKFDFLTRDVSPWTFS